MECATESIMPPRNTTFRDYTLSVKIIEGEARLSLFFLLYVEEESIIPVIWNWLFERMKCRFAEFLARREASRVKCKRSLLWKVWRSGSNDNFKTSE